MELTFNFERETKGTKRFQEDAEEPSIGTLYVRKAALAKLGYTDDTKPLVVTLKVGK